MAQEGTRERLVAAAREVFYQQGYLRTTLAEVAAAADIPVGNVYYHFKAKDSLLAAVIADHQQAITAACAVWDRLPDPRARLRAFFRVEAPTAQQLAQYGCPYGTLCQELVKLASPLAAQAQQLLTTQIEWVARQLAQLGKADTAHDEATALVALQQGLFLLTNTLRAPDLLMHHLDRLDAWLTNV